MADTPAPKFIGVVDTTIDNPYVAFEDEQRAATWLAADPAKHRLWRVIRVSYGPELSAESVPAHHALVSKVKPK